MRTNLHHVLLPDGGGQQGPPGPAARIIVGEDQGHPTGDPGPVEDEDVASASGQFVPKAREALQVDGEVVDEETVGEALDGSEREAGKAAVVEGVGDGLELAVTEEAEASRLRHHVEGERTLGRREGRGREDPASMERAPPRDLGDRPRSVEEPHAMGPGVPDREGTMAARAHRLLRFVAERAEGSGVTRHAERGAGGGGC